MLPHRIIEESLAFMEKDDSLKLFTSGPSIGNQRDISSSTSLSAASRKLFYLSDIPGVPITIKETHANDTNVSGLVPATTQWHYENFGNTQMDIGKGDTLALGINRHPPSSEVIPKIIAKFTPGHLTDFSRFQTRDCKMGNPSIALKNPDGWQNFFKPRNRGNRNIQNSPESTSTDSDFYTSDSGDHDSYGSDGDTIDYMDSYSRVLFGSSQDLINNRSSSKSNPIKNNPSVITRRQICGLESIGKHGKANASIYKKQFPVGVTNRSTQNLSISHRAKRPIPTSTIRYKSPMGPNGSSFSKRSPSSSPSSGDTSSDDYIPPVPSDSLLQKRSRASLYPDHLEDNDQVAQSETYIHNIAKRHKSSRCIIPDHLQEYKVSAKLGSGTFGQVFLARKIATSPTNDTPESQGTFSQEILMALKRVELPHSKISKDIREDTSRELEILHALGQHENITSLVSVVIDEKAPIDGRGNKYFYMGFKYMAYDLLSLRKEHQRILDTVAKKTILFLILRGLEFIHNKGIIHRDLKPSNILVSTDGNVKIADYGAATFHSPSRGYHNAGQITVNYRPPEMLLFSLAHGKYKEACSPRGADQTCKNHSCLKYGTEVDMWSFACIALELLVNKNTHIYGALFTNETTSGILTGIFDLLGAPSPKNWPEGRMMFPNFFRGKSFPLSSRITRVYGETLRSHGALDFIERIFQLDPKNRPTASAALSHPWFSEEPRVRSMIDPYPLIFPARPGHEAHISELLRS